VRGHKDKPKPWELPYREPPVVDGKVPPHDLDAEAAILSACLLDESACDQVTDLLEPLHFYSDPNRTIYSAVLGIRARDMTPDLVTVANWLRAHELMGRAGGTPYLGQMIDSVPSVARVREYAELVVDKWRLRRLIATCQKYSAYGYGDVGEIGHYIDQVEHEVFQLAEQVDGDNGPVRLRQVIIQVERERAKGIQPGLKTGYDGYDALTGGMFKGDMITVAARPGMGKSGWVTGIAANVARREVADERGETRRRNHVALFSIEMPKEQVYQRLVSAEAGVDLKRLREDDLTAVEWERVTRAKIEIADWPIHIDDSPDLTIPKMRARSRRIQTEARKEGGELVLVVLDYLQLMDDPDGRSREEEVSRCSRGCKKTAKALKIPVIVLSQLNRSVETRGKGDKRPQLSDLRESGAIEQDSDVVVFIFREHYYDEPGTADQTDGKTELLVRKQRNGPAGRAHVRFHGGSASFSDMRYEDAEPF